jgi:hypothetical protein
MFKACTSGFCAQSAYATKFCTIFLLLHCKETVQNDNEMSDAMPMCDNSRCLVVPNWYANDYCRVLALVQTQCAPESLKYST